MPVADLKLDRVSCDLLTALKERRLLTVDMVVVARNNMSWNTVRIHATDIDIDIAIDIEPVVMDEFGTTDEFGIMQIRPAEPTTLCMPDASSDTTTFGINKSIKSVSIANASIEVFGEGNLVASIAYPQAIAIQFDDGWIVFDKECWFSEMVAVKQGASLKGLLYDGAPDWEDDPDDPSTHYDYSIELINL